MNYENYKIQNKEYFTQPESYWGLLIVFFLYQLSTILFIFHPSLYSFILLIFVNFDYLLYKTYRNIYYIKIDENEKKILLKYRCLFKGDKEVIINFFKLRFLFLYRLARNDNIRIIFFEKRNFSIINHGYINIDTCNSQTKNLFEKNEIFQEIRKTLKKIRENEKNNFNNTR